MGRRSRGGRRRKSWSGCWTFRDKYADFTVSTFHEQLNKSVHGYVLGYTGRSWTACGGFGAKAPKRSRHRKERPRRPLRDAAALRTDRATWIEGLPAMDLIVTLAIDERYLLDALSRKKDGHRLPGLGRVIGDHGLFCALYTDRAFHYFITRKAGERSRTDAPNPSGTDLSHLDQAYRAYRRRRVGAPSGCSARCRAGCRRTCGSPGSGRGGCQCVVRAHYIAEHNAACDQAEQEDGVRADRTKPGARRCRVEGANTLPTQYHRMGRSRLQLPESRLRPTSSRPRYGFTPIPMHRQRILGRTDWQVCRQRTETAPTHLSPAAARSRQGKPSRARKRASLTAPARAAIMNTRSGGRKRLQATKKQSRATAGSIHGMT